MEFTYYNPVKLFHGATKIGEVAEEVKSLETRYYLSQVVKAFIKTDTLIS